MLELQKSGELCANCGKKKARGSITWWIFRGDSCVCAEAQGTADGSAGVASRPFKSAHPIDVPLKAPPQSREPMVDPNPELAATMIGNHYKVGELIGVGGMSAVYKGWHELLNKTVAIKVLLPEMLNSPKGTARLQREAQAAASLDHPNIVKVHEFFIAPDGKPFLIMDYVEGKSLDETVESAGALDVVQARALVIQICDALQYAHERNIAHRDLKPSNVIVTPSGQIKIVDFGMAKELSPSLDGRERLTQTGEIFGSPLYMSPEQCLGKVPDQRTDIYSLGCVMFEMLTAEPLFTGENVVQVILAQINESPAPALQRSKISQDLQEILCRALAKDPRDRYQSMAEMRDHLSGANIGPARTSVAASRPGSMPRFSARAAAVVAGSIAAAAAAGYLLYSLSQQHPGAPGSPGAGNPVVATANGDREVAFDRHMHEVTGINESDPDATKIEKLKLYLSTRAPRTFTREVWRGHDWLRHCYSALADEHNAYAQCDIIFKDSLMDQYILNTLADWGLRDKETARATAMLSDAAEKYPELKYLRAACWIQLAQLYASSGDPDTSQIFLNKVLNAKDAELGRYRTIAALENGKLAVVRKWRKKRQAEH